MARPRTDDKSEADPPGGGEGLRPQGLLRGARLGDRQEGGGGGRHHLPLLPQQGGHPRPPLRRGDGGARRRRCGRAISGLPTAPERLRAIAEHHLGLLGDEPRPRRRLPGGAAAVHQVHGALHRLLAPGLLRAPHGSRSRRGSGRASSAPTSPRRSRPRPSSAPSTRWSRPGSSAGKGYDLAELAAPRGRPLPARGGGAREVRPRPPGPRRGRRGARRHVMTPRTLLRPLLPLGRHLPEDRAPQVQAGRRLARDQLRRARAPRWRSSRMGLRDLGVEKGDRVAILSENRPEWAFADLATLCAGACDVPDLRHPDPGPGALHPERQRERRSSSSRTRPRRRRCAEVQGQAPDAPARRAAWTTRPSRARLSLEELRARGKEALARDKDAVRAARRRGGAGRPRHPHLHLGHHRRSQGRDAHPREPRLERARRDEGLPRARARRRVPVLPSPLPRLRAHGRPLPDALRGA